MAGEDTAKVAGNWQMSFESPHGTMQAALRIEQDGSKLSGTCDMEPLGSMALNGSAEGNKVSFSIEVKERQLTLTFNGKVDGDKMSGTAKPMDSAWMAKRQ